MGELFHYFVSGSFDTENLAHLDTIIRNRSINFTLWSIGILLVLSAISALVRKQSQAFKVVMFFLMIGLITLNTIYLAAATIYKNHRSITGGPVHWHADFEVWNCGHEVDLIDPSGWSNRIGTPVFHEHNDKRAHVEGVVLREGEVSLGEFFKVIGGNLDMQNLRMPLNDGTTLDVSNGQDCNGQPGMVQVFAYHSEGEIFKQERLLYPEDYIMRAESGVPPGDCIIVEFDQPKDRTDKLCQSYQVQVQLGKLKEI